MSTTPSSLSPNRHNNDEPHAPNIKIAANNSRTLSDSEVRDTRDGRLHGRTWFSHDIDEKTQFRVTTELAGGRKWKVDARDWYWDGTALEWRRSKTGGCFRSPYALDAARAVVTAAEALRRHGAPFDDGRES